MSTDDVTQAPKLAQCTITGKMVPEDELVTIQGHRVCAEGKAILLERLKAGEALPGEQEKPGVLRRFGCIFLDGLIIGVPFAIVNGIVVGATGSALAAGLVSIIATTVQIVYFGQMHGSGGQTVGKKAGKLVVINMDGSPVTLGTAYTRAVAYAGPGYLSAIASLTGLQIAVGIAGAVVGLYGLANALCALFDRNMQRAIHDRIAGTRVVERS